MTSNHRPILTVATGHGDAKDAAVAEIQDDTIDSDDEDDAPVDVGADRVDEEIASPPSVRVLHDEVPPGLQVSRFLGAMVEGVLRASPSTCIRMREGFVVGPRWVSLPADLRPRASR